MRQWCGADGRLCEYKLATETPRKVVHRRTFPDGTGYQENLYRIEEMPGPLSQQFEATFMQMIDTEAAKALRRIKSGDPTPWPGGLRSSWTRFLLGFLFRHPEAVALFKNHLMELWRAGLEGLRENYAQYRRPHDPETYEDYLRGAPSYAPFQAALVALQDVIDNQKNGPIIFNMHWSRLPLREARRTLLTSDRPLEMPFGLERDDAFAAFPIGPHDLFFAAKDNNPIERLTGVRQDEIVKNFNKGVVSRAQRFVWGADNSHFQLVEKQIKTSQDRILLTDAQRAEAIAVARGHVWESEDFEATPSAKESA